VYSRKTSGTYHNTGDALGDDFQRHSNDLKISGRLQNTAVVANNEEDRVDEPANKKEVQQVLVELTNLLLLLAQKLYKEISNGKQIDNMLKIRNGKRSAQPANVHTSSSSLL
jgi:hypothetical protein